MSSRHISTRPPGTYAAYRIDRCRCYPCANAVATYNRERDRAILNGTWHPFTDARPVRDHLALLAAHGIGWRRAAYLAGISNGAVKKLLYGAKGRPPSLRVRTENAKALLSVRPRADVAADHAIVDATGYRRRLQALIARGFTQDHLAQRLGVINSTNLHIADAERVLARKHRAAQRLYDELWDQDPIAHGVTPAGATRARAFAAKRGWPPPAAWDDDTIDDPAVTPDLGEKTLRQDAIVEDAQWIAETAGADRVVIAQRLGISRNYLEKTLERAAQAA